MADVREAAKTASVGFAAGALVAAVVGGLFARVGMRVIAVTTDALSPVTLTGNRIGEITLGGTLSVMGSVAPAGALLGLVYVGIRRWLPPAHRPLSFAVVVLLIPGALFLGDDEFELFEPSLLAAAVLLPAFPLSGFVLAAIVERIRPAGETRPSSRSRIALSAVLAAGLAVGVLNLAQLGA